MGSEFTFMALQQLIIKSSSDPNAMQELRVFRQQLLAKAHPSDLDRLCLAFCFLSDDKDFRAREILSDLIESPDEYVSKFARLGLLGMGQIEIGDLISDSSKAELAATCDASWVALECWMKLERKFPIGKLYPPMAAIAFASLKLGAAVSIDSTRTAIRRHRLAAAIVESALRYSFAHPDTAFDEVAELAKWLMESRHVSKSSRAKICHHLDATGSRGRGETTGGTDRPE